MHPPWIIYLHFLRFQFLVFQILHLTYLIFLDLHLMQLYIFNILLKIFLCFILFRNNNYFYHTIVIINETWTESSIWSSLFFTIILLEIYFSKEIDYVKIVTLISIATLFRITVFITLIPLLIFYFYKFFKIKKKK